MSLQKSNDSEAVKCFEVKDGELLDGIGISREGANLNINLGSVAVPIEVPDYFSGERIYWAKLVNGSGTLSITACNPQLHSSRNLVRLIAVDNCRPLLRYNNDPRRDKLLRQGETSVTGMTFHYEGVQALALMEPYDEITVFQKEARRFSRKDSYSSAWSVSFLDGLSLNVSRA